MFRFTVLNKVKISLDPNPGHLKNQSTVLRQKPTPSKNFMKIDQQLCE